jgi:hypothetical protein
MILDKNNSKFPLFTTDNQFFSFFDNFTPTHFSQRIDQMFDFTGVLGFF